LIAAATGAERLGCVITNGEPIRRVDARLMTAMELVADLPPKPADGRSLAMTRNSSFLKWVVLTSSRASLLKDFFRNRR